MKIKKLNKNIKNKKYIFRIELFSINVITINTITSVSKISQALSEFENFPMLIKWRKSEFKFVPGTIFKIKKRD